MSIYFLKEPEDVRFIRIQGFENKKSLCKKVKNWISEAKIAVLFVQKSRM